MAELNIAQASRMLVVESPLGPDVLILRQLAVTETLSRPFLIEATVLSRRQELKPSELIGRAITCTIQRPGCPARHFYGFIRHFARVGLAERGLATYRVEAVPRLWNLSRTVDCRIFQQTSVGDIIRTLLQEGGVSPVEFNAPLPSATRSYVVQYNETDLDFLQRLLAEIGFAYFFRHEKEQHTLVLTAADGRSPPVPGAPAVVSGVSHEAPEILTEWREATAVGPTGIVAHDHDLLSHARLIEDQTGGAGGEWEVFRWPGGQTVRGDATPSKVAMETVESGSDWIEAAGSDPAVFAGAKLAVRLSNQAAAVKPYLLTAVRHDAYDETHLAEGGGAGYASRLSLMPATRSWRDPQPWPRPSMTGVQSAIVTGPPGEEIHCDAHGRVRVRFLWDRKGQKDDRSSCWVRVAQAWAGNGRGFWALPRVGDEVLVAFVDGDPDRPVVIGSLHGAEAATPFALPANATQSGLLTRSSKGGAVANANMLRFEDKKDNEEIALHAERDFNTSVERDSTETVGRDRIRKVKRHRSTTIVEGHETLDVTKGNRTVTIAAGNDTLKVSQGNISVTAAAGSIMVEAAQKITLKVGKTVLELDPMKLSIKAGMVEVKADMLVKIESGALIEEKAGAVFTMTGALIKLN